MAAEGARAHGSFEPAVRRPQDGGQRVHVGAGRVAAMAAATVLAAIVTFAASQVTEPMADAGVVSWPQAAAFAMVATLVAFLVAVLVWVRLMGVVLPAYWLGGRRPGAVDWSTAWRGFRCLTGPQRDLVLGHLDRLSGVDRQPVRLRGAEIDVASRRVTRRIQWAQLAALLPLLATFAFVLVSGQSPADSRWLDLALSNVVAPIVLVLMAANVYAVRSWCAWHQRLATAGAPPAPTGPPIESEPTAR